MNAFSSLLIDRVGNQGIMVIVKRPVGYLFPEIIFLNGEKLCLLPVIPLFPQIFHRKFLMPDIMSVILKANLNSSSVPEGGRGLWQAEGWTGFHTGIASPVTLQLSVAAEHLRMPASVSDTCYFKCRHPASFLQAAAYSKFPAAVFLYNS